MIPGVWSVPYSDPCLLIVTDNSLETMQCYKYHLQGRSRQIKSICDSYKKYLDCSHVDEPDPKVRHGGNCRVPEQRCDWGKCSICEKIVHLATHQCFIQRLPEDVDDSKLKYVARNEVGKTPFDEPEPGYPNTLVYLEREPPSKYTATTKPPLMPRKPDTHSSPFRD